MATVSTSHNDMAASFNFSPHAACFFAAPFEQSQCISKLSPHATIFISTSSKRISRRSTFSPHAAVFVATSSDRNVCTSEMAYLKSMDPALRNIFNDGIKCLQSLAALKESFAAAELGLAAFSIQYDITMQQDADCSHHYNTLLNWRDYGRYGEEVPEEDFECASPSADVRRSRCSKCRDYLLDMEQSYQDTWIEYLRLAAEYVAAIDEFNENSGRYNESLAKYCAPLVTKAALLTEGANARQLLSMARSLMLNGLN